MQLLFENCFTKCHSTSYHISNSLLISHNVDFSPDTSLQNFLSCLQTFWTSLSCNRMFSLNSCDAIVSWSDHCDRHKGRPPNKTVLWNDHQQSLEYLEPLLPAGPCANAVPLPLTVHVLFCYLLQLFPTCLEHCEVCCGFEFTSVSLSDTPWSSVGYKSYPQHSPMHSPLTSDSSVLFKNNFDQT